MYWKTIFPIKCFTAVFVWNLSFFLIFLLHLVHVAFINHVSRSYIRYNLFHLNVLNICQMIMRVTHGSQIYDHVLWIVLFSEITFCDNTFLKILFARHVFTIGTCTERLTMNAHIYTKSLRDLQSMQHFEQNGIAFSLRARSMRKTYPARPVRTPSRQHKVSQHNPL